VSAAGSPSGRPSVLGSAHAGITVSDMDASLAFYGDGLGLEVEFDLVRDARYQHEVLALPFRDIRMAQLVIPGPGLGRIELLEYRRAERRRAASEPCDPATGHLCLVVDDAAAMLARMTGLGYRARTAAVVDIDAGANTGGLLVYLADPDGYWVELLQRPAAPAAPTIGDPAR
jgi:lactoylglutathione lyase